jgi:hypothetical protein
MRRCRVTSLLIVAACAALLTACSQTSRIDIATSTESLSQTGRAVAVMRLGMASPNCMHVGVWLGVREGPGYRLHKPVSVIHAASLADVPGAEVELSPGEYHVVSYACGTGSDVQQIATYDATTGLVRTSHATFTVAVGEVVNVGSFELHAARVGTNAFGRRVSATVVVNDWPSADLERYKAKRPQIYAQMKTRLMTVVPNGSADIDADNCAEVRQLKADGKIQNLPSTCAAQAAAGPLTATARPAGKRP